MSHPAQIGFQDSTSPVMEELLFFHDHALMLILLVSIFVLYTISLTISTNLSDKLIINSQEFELGWTILPVAILSILAVPSIRALYILDESVTPSLTIKAVGNQWFWNYEYTDFGDLSFDSYMIPPNEINYGQFRLLEADNRMIIPTETLIRLIVTSEDVLHSWALPSLGVKVDAIPGRLNQTSFYSYYPGVFYGQCSEICGINHSFMPIVVEAVPTPTFESWATMELAKTED